MSYKKCPRCELNYIKDVEEVLCKVCLSEVSKAIRANDEEEDYELCSECGENIIKASEDMCHLCFKEHMTDEADGQIHKKDGWEDFLPKDEDDIFVSEEDEDDDLGDLEEIDLDDDESDLEEI